MIANGNVVIGVNVTPFHVKSMLFINIILLLLLIAYILTSYLPEGWLVKS